MAKKKGFFTEFKEFISQGNVLDLAIGVVIGGAFQAIIKAIVDNLLMPLVSLLAGGTDYEKWQVVLGSGPDAATLKYGLVISAVINFLIIALVIFLVIKLLTNVKNRVSAPTEIEKTDKECPYCLSTIPIAATRCPFCTSKLEGYKPEELETAEQ